ncbi:tail fiber domain-containing protein [Zooshikella sp. RANM57]|uniref:tail fiber domain-containing protein n=1 Tax=Zooshikella sp. RANM57 TaxID=3425863 RepID=UPI003D6EA51B
MKKFILASVLLMSSSPLLAGSHEMCKHLTGDAYTECLSRPNFMRFSDRRLKQNEVIVEDALNKVIQLNGKYFEWKHNNRQDIGVIAQEVEAVFPELVSADKKTGFKQVNYAGLVGVLIEAVKELKRENIHLKQQLGLYY